MNMKRAGVPESTEPLNEHIKCVDSVALFSFQF